MMNDIKSDITFIIKQDKKPYYDSAAITGLEPKLYFKTLKKKVLIKNARKLKNCDLDIQGFQFYKHNLNYNKINITSNLKGSKKDISKFLKNIIPYKEIFIFDVTKRSNTTNGANNIDGARRPAERAHVDYTEDSAPKRALDIMGNNYYNKVFNTKRIMQLNVWFPLSAIVLSSPLAFADYRSIYLSDLVATDQHFPKRIGEIYHLAYNKKQEWYWLPDMKNNELIILKGWDSLVKSSISRFTPHTSFNLKAQDTIKYPRESIEVRAFLVI